MQIWNQSSRISLWIGLWEKLHFNRPWLQNLLSHVTLHQVQIFWASINFLLYVYISLYLNFLIHPHCSNAENGYSKRATEQMDVYSFGVVLLELVTGRQAEQAESAESIDIVKWVRRKINITDGALQVLDPKISNSSQQEMLGALEMALRCTSVMPEKRPTMFEVVRALQSLSSKTPHIQDLELSIGTSDEHSSAPI